MYSVSESKLIDTVGRSPKYEQLVCIPVDDELKVPNKIAFSTKMVEPVNAGLTDEPIMCTGMNAAQPLVEGECNALELELGRCLEFELDSTQIGDIQGLLFPCLSFWEQVLRGPSPSP